MNYTANKNVKLNLKSQLRINKAIEAIASELNIRDVIINARAKYLLKDLDIYETIQDVTLQRIGEWGQQAGLFKYDSSLGQFYKEKPFVHENSRNPVAPIKLSSFVEEWSKETIPDNTEQSVVRSRIYAQLYRWGSPDVNADIVKLVQDLYEKIPYRNGFKWTVLESLRSFVSWCIETQKIKGDKDLLWIPERLSGEIKVGSNTARILPGTMTDTNNRWSWMISNAGIQSLFTGTEEEVRQHLLNISYESDDKVEEIGEYFNENEEVSNTEPVEIDFEGKEPLDPKYLDELVNQITVPDTVPDVDLSRHVLMPINFEGRVTKSITSDEVRIPRLVIDRILQVCDQHPRLNEITSLIKVYTS